MRRSSIINPNSFPPLSTRLCAHRKRKKGSESCTFSVVNTWGKENRNACNPSKIKGCGAQASTSTASKAPAARRSSRSADAPASCGSSQHSCRGLAGKRAPGTFADRLDISASADQWRFSGRLYAIYCDLQRGSSTICSCEMLCVAVRFRKYAAYMQRA